MYNHMRKVAIWSKHLGLAGGHCDLLHFGTNYLLMYGPHKQVPPLHNALDYISCQLVVTNNFFSTSEQHLFDNAHNGLMLSTAYVHFCTFGIQSKDSWISFHLITALIFVEVNIAKIYDVLFTFIL